MPKLQKLKGASSAAFLRQFQVVLQLKCYSDGLCHAGESATIIPPWPAAVIRVMAHPQTETGA
jgi:hypothetical protein